MLWGIQKNVFFSMLLLVVRKNDQPIGVIVHSNYFECLLQRWTDEGRVAVDCKKTQVFLNTL